MANSCCIKPAAAFELRKKVLKLGTKKRVIPLGSPVGCAPNYYSDAAIYEETDSLADDLGRGWGR